MTDLIHTLRKFGAESNDGFLRGPALNAADEIERLRAHIAALETLVADCAVYLKDGETPRQRMDRDHDDVLALMAMLAKDRTERDRLRAALAPLVALAGVIRQDAEKATPGPWWLSWEMEPWGAKAAVEAGSAEVQVFSMPLGFDDPVDEAIEANARLIVSLHNIALPAILVAADVMKGDSE